MGGRMRPASYRVLHKLHLWIGLALCLPLVLAGLTGSLLVFEHEIKDMFAPSPPVLEKGAPRGVDAIVGAAAAAAPPGYVPSLYRAPEHDGAPAGVAFAKKGAKKGKGDGVEIRVDPASLRVLGTEAAKQGVFRTVLRLHADLLLPGGVGRKIVGSIGIALFFLSCSGLFLWLYGKGRRLKEAFLLRKNLRGLAFCRSLHGVAGAWGFALLALTAFTGAYLAFPDAAGTMVRAVLPGRDLRKEADALRVVPPKDGASVPAGVALDAAMRVVAGAEAFIIRFPSAPDRPYRVMLKFRDAPSDPVATVFVDPGNGAVLAVHDPRRYAAGETFSAWQRVLHGGHGVDSLWFKAALFATGLLPLLFSVTGIAMWRGKGRVKKSG
jgi:uncharacterized iron-regulated membrane protein